MADREDAEPRMRRGQVEGFRSDDGDPSRRGRAEGTRAENVRADGADLIIARQFRRHRMKQSVKQLNESVIMASMPVSTHACKRK